MIELDLIIQQSLKVFNMPATLDMKQIVQLRGQFPALQRKVGNQTAIFFDGPAGTQVPQRVIDVMTHYLSETNANHGGSFATSIESDCILAESHQAFADLFNTDDPDELYFGQNMTSLTFALSRSLAQTWDPGDEIVVTRLDHDANVMPWILAARDRDVTVRHVAFRDDDFLLDMDSLRAALSEKTRLVAVGCASNATGGINSVREIADLAHEVGALVLLDAVHSAPHRLIDVRAFECDFLVCSAYKFFGPHIGTMWGRRELLEQLAAYKVRPATDSLPGKWMTGTQSHESIAGAAAAIDYVADIGRQSTGNAALSRREALCQAYSAIGQYESDLSCYLARQLRTIPGLKIWGVTDESQFDKRCSTFSITLEGVEPQQMAQRLADSGIFVWHGNYYALEFTQCCGLEPQGMLRVGLVHYNTTEEIDRLAGELRSLS
ncbi:MAG: cysteine desulfurase-like protein [Planctomycetales bacterium]